VSNRAAMKNWKQIGDVARDVTERVGNQGGNIHPIDFGKVKYEPGAPKNAPRWIWRCGCVKCRDLPFPEGVHGPFKTARAAGRDIEQFLTLFYSDCGARH
jgi:hypothetical protein